MTIGRRVTSSGAGVALSLATVLLVGAPVLALPVTPDPSPPPGPSAAERREVGYAGPGREDPDPVALDEVRLGYFGPQREDDPEGGEFWCGAALAIEDVNLEGGYKGLPFRLVGAWSKSPWGSGAAQVTQIVFGAGVWAIVGSIDGASSHVVEQVAAKAFLTVISPGSTDKTVNMANVPWMFSPLPSDDVQAGVIGRALVAAGPDFALISTTDHDARMTTQEFSSWLSREGRTPRVHVEWSGEEGVLQPLAKTVADLHPSAVLVLAGAGPSARVVKALRAQGFKGRILGGATLGRRSFVAQAGPDAEGAVFPLLYEPGAEWDAFQDRFIRRYGHRPDYAAGQAYDAVRVLVASVRRGGLNRARIGDAVRELSPWRGVMGLTRWDARGRSERPVALGTISEGRVALFGQ